MKNESIILTQNLGLIKSIAKKFTNNEIDLQDYVQIGCIGFIKALRKYDSNVGKLSTWSYPHIYYEILQHIQKNSKIKLKTNQNFSIEKSNNKYNDLTEYFPLTLTGDEKRVILLRVENYTLHEIAKITNLSYNKINKMLVSAVNKIRRAN